MASLRNEDYTDRELLHVIAAIGEHATTDEIAEALGLSSNGTSRAVRISSRLAWMRRYGFIDSVDPSSLDRPPGGGHGYKLWQVTPIGRELMGGRLNKSVVGAVERADAGQQLLLMRQLTRHEADEATRAALRREYAHNAAKQR